MKNVTGRKISILRTTEIGIQFDGSVERTIDVSRKKCEMRMIPEGVLIKSLKDGKEYVCFNGNCAYAALLPAEEKAEEHPELECDEGIETEIPQPHRKRAKAK